MTDDDRMPRRTWPSYADVVDRGGKLGDEHGPFRWRKDKRKGKQQAPIPAGVARIVGEIK